MEIHNRKAKYDYEILETYEAGLALMGTEIKSIRKGSANLKGRYEEGNRFNHEENRTRKLLLHKKEIRKIKQSIELDGLTLVPIKLYFHKNRAKILVGVARGKKNYDKRETIKKRDMEREVRKELKYR